MSIEDEEFDENEGVKKYSDALKDGQMLNLLGIKTQEDFKKIKKVVKILLEVVK